MNPIKAMIYRFGPARLAFTKLRDAKGRRDYQHQYQSLVLQDKRILFCAYSGRQYACSPKALYEEMLQEHPDYTFVWAFLDPQAFAELADNPNTTLVKYDSEAFRKELSICKYWVFNTRVPSYAVKKEGQVYVQTWHGTPLKRLGYDVREYIKGADDKISLRYSYRSDAVRYDYLLSPSPFYSEKMTSAFHLDALGKSQVILEKGYPRNDSLYTATPEDILRIRNKLGIAQDDFVILYAPTWREDKLNPAVGSTYGNGIDFDLHVDLKKLAASANRNTKILLRTHYFVKHTSVADDAQILDMCEYPDINELYLAADLLITDYSSVFFDYAILDKPILFYMYDLESYQNVRDFYFPLSELPGPVIQQEEELYDAVQQIAAGNTNIEYSAFHRKFHPIPGPVSKQIWQEILK